MAGGFVHGRAVPVHNVAVLPCWCSGTLAAANLALASEDGGSGATKLLLSISGPAHVAALAGLSLEDCRALTQSRSRAVAPGALPR